MQLRKGGLGQPQIVALLALHAGGMRAKSPADACHFLDVAALRRPDILFLSAWDGDTLLGIGALKALGDGRSEIKSMRTAQTASERGVSTTTLNELTARALARSDHALFLETGTGAAFDAAHRRYVRHGFTPCGPLGTYEATDFNRFYRRELD